MLAKPSLFFLFLIYFFPALVFGEEEAALSQMNLLDDTREFVIGDRLVYGVVEEREPVDILFVNDEGMIDVPLIGMVPAQGKTCKALAYEIKALLEKDFFYRATVILKHQFSDKIRGRVNIVGQVRQQGQQGIPADDILTVSGAILRAGGFTALADREKVTLIRREGQEDEEHFSIDVAHILETGDREHDIPVRSDDLIIIPKKENAEGQVYIIGAVNRPGLYELPSDDTFTISKAILRAGGFSKFANKKAVKLIRSHEDEGEESETFKINVAEILEEGKRDKDMVIKADDIIRVAESWINF